MGKDGASALGIKIAQIAPMPRNKATSQDPTGRRSSDQVEEVSGLLAGDLLDALKDPRRQNAPDSATVDGEDVNRRTGV